jgi:hypothetical protein
MGRLHFIEARKKKKQLPSTTIIANRIFSHTKFHLMAESRAAKPKGERVKSLCVVHITYSLRVAKCTLLFMRSLFDRFLALCAQKIEKKMKQNVWSA